MRLFATLQSYLPAGAHGDGVSLELPPGTTHAWSGLSYQERLASGQTVSLYVISILVIFLCLAALYESWSVPFSVLLVDEPFVGLDQPGKEALLDLLGEAADAGATIVVATHQLEYVGRADRCIGLRDGEVAYDGPAANANVEKLVG